MKFSNIWEIKHLYLCFIAEYNIRTSSGPYELNINMQLHLITRTRTSTYILFCDKSRVPMFNFDSKTTISIVHP